jgi:hypothetical protein
MDLIVVEPPVQAEEAEQLKRALSYLIKIAVSLAFPIAPSGPPPPPPLEKDPHDSGGQSRLHRRTSSALDSGASSIGLQALVHARLGHGAGNDHVVDHGLAREAAAPTPNAAGVSTVANSSGLPSAIDDLAVTVITPACGATLLLKSRENMIPILGETVASLHSLVAVGPPQTSLCMQGCGPSMAAPKQRIFAPLRFHPL